MQQHLVMKFTCTAILVCTVAWELPLWTCVCAVVQGETRTNGRGTPHLLLRSRRKTLREQDSETALTQVSGTEGMYYTSSATEQHNTTHCTQFPLHTHCTNVYQSTSFPFVPSEEARGGRVQNLMLQKDKAEQHKPVQMCQKHCEKWNQSEHLKHGHKHNYRLCVYTCNLHNCN